MTREETIEALERCTQDPNVGNCVGCPYDYVGDTFAKCCFALMLDCLDLLKAQEPRVMTLEEIEDWDGSVFFEAYETDMYYALIETVEPTAGMDGEFVFVNVVPGEHHLRVWGGENYGSIWRCWTSKPDKATREATPWE